MPVCRRAACSQLTEVSKQYHDDPLCKISSPGAGAQCEVTITAPSEMKAPVYVYYEVPAHL